MLSGADDLLLTYQIFLFALIFWLALFKEQITVDIIRNPLLRVPATLDSFINLSKTTEKTDDTTLNEE